MTLELGVIADDLTGGAMVASLLERAGIRTPVVTSVAALHEVAGDAEAVVYAGRHRLMPSAAARRVATDVAEALRVMGCRRLFSKYSATFDSTDDGNIGPVADALLEAMDAPATVFCPGFPESWITVFHGKMFVLDDLLHESFKRHDPVTPMLDSDLVAVLQRQTGRAVGLLGHRVLRQGVAAARAHLADRIAAGESFFVVDSVDDDDIAVCAEAVADWAVTTGADAFPVALARSAGLRTDAGRAARATHPAVGGREILLAGSCAGATARQLARFADEHPVLRIDVAAVHSVDDEARRAIEWAREHSTGGPVGIATTAAPDEVARIKRAVGDDRASEIATAVMQRVASLLSGEGFRRIVVAGGETTGAVLDGLGVDCFEVTPFDDLGGGFCHATSPEPISILCKAGAMGDAGLILRGFDRMRAAEDGEPR